MRYLLALCSLCLCGEVAVHANQTYSEAITAGNFLYVSGQLPIDPTTGQLAQGDIPTLTNLVIDSIQHWLRVKGFTMKDVIKTEVYLRDMRNYAEMDSAYGARFNFQYPPARDVIEASDLLYNSPIEISCIAYKP